MFNNPFADSQKLLIKPETQVVFVADAFLDTYIGGAEFTTEALIEKCPYKFEKVKAKEVDIELLESGHHAFWIFGNFGQLDLELIPTIVANKFALSFVYMNIEVRSFMSRSIILTTVLSSDPRIC